jgi:hypothetical protein
MQIPIIKGVYSGENADYKTSFPLNMMPVIQNTGISKGYLRPVEGIVEIGRGPGISRGAINWNGVHYRVMGNLLCSITEDGTVTSIGNVGDDGGKVTMDYSFDRLAITSEGNLFYWDDTTLTQVTDPDLGTALTVVWVDGYFMTTDGEFLVVTELADPTSVLPTKYGSSEIDPDPVVSLLKLRNEIYAINRYTIEVFDNIGGIGFPFQRIDGAQIQRGALGTYCAIVYEDTIAFLGSGRSEAPAIYLGVNGQTAKISTREIDEILIGFTEEELSEVVFETLNDKSQAFLWIRLPDRTLVYDLTASKIVGEAVWHILSSSVTELSSYRARDVIFCYDKWQIADTTSNRLGVLDNTISTHFGDTTIWEFSTSIGYNESRGVLFKKLELVALTGRNQGFEEAVISTSYSLDGRSWSQDRTINAGKAGDRLKRLVWWRQGTMRNTRIQRFRGDSNAYIAVSRLEADLEPLGA